METKSIEFKITITETQCLRDGAAIEIAICKFITLSSDKVNEKMVNKNPLTVRGKMSWFY